MQSVKRLMHLAFELFCAVWILWVMVAPIPLFGQTCDTKSKEIELNVRTDQRASGFPLRTAERPTLEEALVSVQVGSDWPQQASKVRIVPICEIVPFRFEVKDETVISTSLAIDRELSYWLVGLGQDNKKFLLYGFPEPEKGFNELLQATGTHVADADAAILVLDLYLRLTGGEELRQTVIVDEMQLQSMGLKDFDTRYSLPKAKAAYLTWWNNIGPKLKRQLARPEATSERDDFKVVYYRYDHSRVLRETRFVSKLGTVRFGSSDVLYEGVP